MESGQNSVMFMCLRGIQIMQMHMLKYNMLSTHLLQYYAYLDDSLEIKMKKKI